MKDPRKTQYILLHLVLGMGIAILGGCASAPGSPSVGMPGPPGMPGAPGTLPGTLPGTQDGMPPGQLPGTGRSTTPGDGTSPPPDSTAKSGEKKPAGDDTTSGKTDEQILAEALEEFERSNAKPDGTDKTADDATDRGNAGPGPATDAERARGLDGDLNKEFAEFDRAMLSERDAVKGKDNEEGNRGFDDRDSFGDGEGEDAVDESDETLKTAALDRDKVKGDTGSLKGDKDLPDISRSEIPADLVNAEDDDIIARQLREAAMKERDPELQAKLWDEYRKYKRGT